MPSDQRALAGSPMPASKAHIVSYLAAMMLAIAVPAGLIGAGGAARWVLFGAVAWTLGLAAKVPLSAVAALAMPRARNLLSASVQGTVSSAAELAPVVGLLLWDGVSVLSRLDAALYAASAGCTELLVVGTAVLFAKPSEEHVTRWEQGARVSLCVRHQFLIERAVAVAGHLGSRGLVALAFTSGPSWPAVVAAACFAATDGIATYGILGEWNWSEPSRCRRYQGIFALIAGIELTLLLCIGD